MNKLETLVRDLPDPEAAKRFFDQFSLANRGHADRLLKNDGLLSDVLALSSYSPLLAATLIQNPEYVTWLGKERTDQSVRTKEGMLESLARFSMTNSQVEPHVVFARFRRRELMRIFLKDIRRLGTVAEITEEISNLADAILESALRFARQEIDNRFGQPFEIDEKGRKRHAEICIVSLGKLGSKELNYSSDIDLLFVYSAEGSTAGTGTKGAVTSREYFVKLAESVTALIGRQTGEGAAYRVDLRLRPHGRVGALAMSLHDTVRYYLTHARGWEQQVLIRSRASAGDGRLFKEFFSRVEDTVFRPGRDVDRALEDVFLSKQRIDLNRRNRETVDVKLDPGGIREIEFIAQALQLAYGGADRWLRAPHTLISISRLADRGLLSEAERSDLSNAYSFLRRLEHVLQMEHGLQTHSIPNDEPRLDLIARKMQCGSIEEFRTNLDLHRKTVHEAFRRVFRPGREETKVEKDGVTSPDAAKSVATATSSAAPEQAKTIEERPLGVRTGQGVKDDLRMVSDFSPRFSEFIASRPWLTDVTEVANTTETDDYAAFFEAALARSSGSPDILRELRRTWSGLLVSILVRDVKQEITHKEVRGRLTALAESSLTAAIKATAQTAAFRFPGVAFAPKIVGLGKLGSGTLDYDSDLDVVVAYDESASEAPLGEAYARGVESVLNILSSITRDGNLYRVDLRLRPHGKSGPLAVSSEKLINYLENDAAVWELLAYAQLRLLEAFDKPLEHRLRRAAQIRTTSLDKALLRAEARETRRKLEIGHAGRASEVDIKFGPGGLMDVYFAVRYLSLVERESIDPAAYSTAQKLDEFHRLRVISPDIYESLRNGHAFLSELDHNIRLVAGRTSKLPRSAPHLIWKVSTRMKLRNADSLEESLSMHRMNIRSAYEEILFD